VFLVVTSVVGGASCLILLLLQLRAVVGGHTRLEGSVRRQRFRLRDYPALVLGSLVGHRNLWYGLFFPTSADEMLTPEAVMRIRAATAKL